MMRVAITSVAVLGAVLSASVALSAERCRVTDPTGTPLNVLDANMNVIGALENGGIVIVKRYGEDRRGKPGPSRC